MGANHQLDAFLRTHMKMAIYLSDCSSDSPTPHTLLMLPRFKYLSEKLFSPKTLDHDKHLGGRRGTRITRPSETMSSK